MTDFVTGLRNARDSIGESVYEGLSGFGGGAVVGVLAGSSIFLSGGVCAVSAVANFAVGKAAEEVGKTKNWNKSTVMGIKACSLGITCVATIATLVALGIIGPLGAILLGVGAAIWFSAVVDDAYTQRQNELSHVPSYPVPVATS